MPVKSGVETGARLSPDKNPITAPTDEAQKHPENIDFALVQFSEIKPISNGSGIDTSTAVSATLRVKLQGRKSKICENVSIILPFNGDH